VTKVMYSKNSWGAFVDCPWDEGMDLVTGILWQRARVHPEVPEVPPPVQPEAGGEDAPVQPR